MNTNTHNAIVFFQALAEGNLAGVLAALDQGASPNTRFKLYSLRPLHIAAAGYGRAHRAERRAAKEAFNQIAAVLIERGADPLKLDERNWTPAAAGEGDIPPALRTALHAHRDAGTLEVLTGSCPRVVGATSSFRKRPTRAQMGAKKYRATKAEMAERRAKAEAQAAQPKPEAATSSEEAPKQYAVRDLERLIDEGVFDTDTDFDADPMTFEGQALTPVERCFAEDEANYAIA